jgi:hypothetical protein
MVEDYRSEPWSICNWYSGCHYVGKIFENRDGGTQIMKKWSYCYMILPVIITILLLALNACASPEPTTPSVPLPTFAPAISYVKTSFTEADNPAAGASVNFFVRTTEYPDTSPVHIIYYYDVNPPTTPGQPAYTAPGTYMIKVELEESTTWQNIPPGRHTFSAQLVNPDDDTPFDTPVIAQSVVTIPSPVSKTPLIRIMSVQVNLPLPESLTETTQAPLPPLAVEINSAVRYIKLNDDNIGKQNVPGEGHIIYYLDVEPPTFPDQLATTNPGTFISTTEDFHLWENVPTGRHVFSIQLVNNDDTSLDPVVIGQTIITIPSKI